MDRIKLKYLIKEQIQKLTEQSSRDLNNSQIHWFGGACGEGDTAQGQSMCIAWSSISVGYDNGLPSTLSACTAYPDSDIYCKYSTQLFWEATGSPNVGDVIAPQYGICQQYLGTTDNFQTLPENCDMEMGWADGTGLLPASITSCDSTECGGEEEEPEPDPDPIDNCADVVAHYYAFDGCEEDNGSLQCGGFSNVSEFCSRCNIDYEAAQNWAQLNNPQADCDCCPGLDTGTQPGNNPEIDRMRKLAGINKSIK